MPKIPLTKFLSGEVTPLLDARADSVYYNKGVKTLQNFTVLPYGGITRRFGGRYIATSPLSTGSAIKLIPFIFSKEQAYVLEFTNLQMRVYANKVLVTGGVLPLTTPYASGDIPTLQYTQSADTLYITHPTYAPRKITRTGSTAWTISTLSFTGGPWFERTINTDTITPSATYGLNVTLTGTAGSAVFANLLSGSAIEITHPEGTGIATLISTSGGTGYDDAQVNIVEPLGDIAATMYFRFSDKYPTSNNSGISGNGGGNPACVSFYEDRLMFAGSDSNLQTVFGSRSGDYENMCQSALDDAALQYEIASNEVNVVNFLQSGKGLIIGTAGGIFSMSGSNQTDALTPTNVQVKKVISDGCENARPLSFGNEVLYIQRNGKKLRGFSFQFAADSFVTRDLSILAFDMTLSEIAYQRDPYQTIWGISGGTGRLVGLSLNNEQEVVAWHKHSLGVGIVSGTTVRSLAIIPSGSSDEVWVVVERVINGSFVQHVEVMDEHSLSGDYLQYYVLLDSSIVYNGSSTTTITGLSHLEGETVQILADGLVQADKTVSSGQITLDTAASDVVVGLHADSILETLQLDLSNEKDTTQSATKRISNLAVRMYRSVGGKIGTDSTDLEDLPMTAGALFSGDAGATLRGGFSDDRRIYFKQDKPLPTTILGLFADVRGGS